jgi:glycosyltransferase involved in cell wall biosynthesis
MFQYLPYLREDWDIHTAPFFTNRYLSDLYRGTRDPLEIAASYVRRLRTALRLGRFDLAWVEGEFFPWMPWAIEKMLAGTDTPLAADYDDAVFHRYDSHPSAVARRLLGRKIAALMRTASTVLAGNEYIASYARAAGARRVHVVPTVVDTSRYEPRIERDSSRLTIGWIGTPKTQHYLRLVAEALEFAQRTLNAKVVAIGAAGNPLDKLPVEIRAWHETTEAAELRAIDVGIMPLVDAPWELGKCGYKLIQYMASGKPVVASPVGVNRQIVEHGIDGYLARGPEEWISAFRLLHEDPRRASVMGSAGRAKVERCFSLAAMAPRVTKILREAAA